MKIYHVTTGKKAKRYRGTGYILKPVRGFNTLLGACYWAIKSGRKIIYEVEGEAVKMPDHHNEFGEAYWIDEDVPVDRIKCVLSAN